MLFKIEFPVEYMFKKRKTRNAKKPNNNRSVYVHMFILCEFDFLQKNVNTNVFVDLQNPLST